MNSYPRPPHYLTEGEFARLKLTDEQWCKLEQKMAKRRYYENASSRELAERGQRMERFLRPVLAAVSGLFYGALALGLIGEITGNSYWDLYSSPLFFLGSTAVASWVMMRK